MYIIYKNKIKTNHGGEENLLCNLIEVNNVGGIAGRPTDTSGCLMVQP